MHNQPSHSFPRDLPLLSLQTFSIPLGLGAALIYFSPLPSLAFVSLGDWSNGASRSLSLPEKPGKEIEDNPGFHAGDKLILERRRRERRGKGEGKCDVQAAFNQSRVSASLNNVQRWTWAEVLFGSKVEQISITMATIIKIKTVYLNRLMLLPSNIRLNTGKRNPLLDFEVVMRTVLL